MREIYERNKNKAFVSMLSDEEKQVIRNEATKYLKKEGFSPSEIAQGIEDLLSEKMYTLKDFIEMI